MTELKAKFGDQLKFGPYLGSYYYAMKWDKEPWNNVELRNAISMASTATSWLRRSGRTHDPQLLAGAAGH